MKLIIFVCAVVGVATALPQFNRRPQNNPFNNNQYNNNQYNNNNNNQYNTNQYSSNTNQGFSGSSKQVVPIIQYSNDISPDGSFQYSYQTGDGISASANGVVRSTGSRDAENSVAQAVQGSYSYTAPDGQVITVNYIADENGYRAEGAHIPTPPPIPAEIAKSLDLIRSTQAQTPVNVNYRQQANQYQQQGSRFTG